MPRGTKNSESFSVADSIIGTMRNAFSAMNAFFVADLFGVHSACADTGVAMYTFLFIHPYTEE